jgi:HDOD domain
VTAKINSANDIVKKLVWGISPRGDFPVSAKIIQDILIQINNPKANAKAIASTIIKEPGLAARVLDLVNSSFFSRNDKITDLEHAVIRIGTLNLIQLCGNLVLLQKFVPLAKKNTVFAHCLSNVISCINLNDQLQFKFSGSFSSGSADADLLCGSFSKLGQLLLSFYFPELYESALRRSDLKQLTISESIYEIIGLSVFDLSSEALAALKIPNYFIDFLKDCSEANRSFSAPLEQKNLPLNSALILAIALKLGDTITAGSDRFNLHLTCESLAIKANLPNSELIKSVASLPIRFNTYCDSLNLILPKLPNYLQDIDKNIGRKEADVCSPLYAAGKDRLFLSDLKVSLQNGETGNSIIARVLEGLIYELKFSRAYYFIPDKTTQFLEIKQSLGDFTNCLPTKNLKIDLNQDSDALPAICWRSGCTEFMGTSIARSSWPLAAIPVGRDEKSLLGIVYAERDKSDSTNHSDIDSATIIMLGEILRQVCGYEDAVG